jgi:hypothetical protein
MSNVIPIAASANVQTSALVMPRHFTKKRLKDAWTDLLATTDATFHVKQHQFTFEMAATLLAKFRAGDPMTATESKELKKLMITLGLAQAEEDGRGKSKRGKNDHYFDE